MNRYIYRAYASKERKIISAILEYQNISLKQVYDFVDLLTIECIFLSKIRTLLDRALSELLASSSKYYNPLHGEKVLNTLIDKLGEECGLLFEKAVIIPLRVVKDRYI